MGKRQLEAPIRFSLAGCLVALWTAGAFPAHAQYAVSAIKHDAGHAEGSSSRVERRDASAKDPIPQQPAWLAGSNLVLGQRTQSIPRAPEPAAPRPEAKAILVGDWTIRIRPARDEWDRRPATQTGTAQAMNAR